MRRAIDENPSGMNCRTYQMARCVSSWDSRTGGTYLYIPPVGGLRQPCKGMDDIVVRLRRTRFINKEIGRDALNRESPRDSRDVFLGWLIA